MNPDRLKWRFARWLGATAGSVCAWANELEQRNDTRPDCPDCRSKDCYCEERAAEQRMYADMDATAYSEGFQDGNDYARSYLLDD